MPTLILTPRYTDDTQLLWKAAGALGWSVERLTNWRVPAHLCDLPEPVLYSEALFGPMLAESLGLQLLSPPEDWLVRLPQPFRLREIVLTTLGHARKSTAANFVKPPNDKSFPAGIYTGAQLPNDYPDDMPVLISEIVVWKKEFRCFILDRTLRTFSIYARYGEVQHESKFYSTAEENQQLRAFLTSLLSDPSVDLPAATVIDVGIIQGKGWACVEQNAAWGAGIYGCDPIAVLEVIRHAAKRR